MATVTHTFVDALPDLPADIAAGKVLPSHWNAVHTVTPLVSDGSEILVTKNTDPDNALNADFTLAAHAADINPISGRLDQTYQLGYNMGPAGNRLDPAEPCFGFSFESFFESGGAELVEFHIAYQNVAGDAFRWFTVGHNRATDVAYMGLTFGELGFYGMAGDQLVKFQASGASLESFWLGAASSFKIEENNLQFFAQRNAADTAYLSLPYLDNSDRHVLRSFTAVGNAPTDGNPFARVQASSISDGQTVFEVLVPTTSASLIYAQKVQGSVAGYMLSELFNTNSSNSNAHSWFDALVGGASGGDPFMSFRVNGVSEWAIGLDNSDSDAFKICNAVFLGSNEAVRIGTDLGVLFGSYTAMAEMTAPSAPAANGVRIYAQDNGAGKTQLMALFSSGAAQQLAIQP